MSESHSHAWLIVSDTSSPETRHNPVLWTNTQREEAELNHFFIRLSQKAKETFDREP